MGAADGGGVGAADGGGDALLTSGDGDVAPTFRVPPDSIVRTPPALTTTSCEDTWDTMPSSKKLTRIRPRCPRQRGVGLAQC